MSLLPRLAGRVLVAGDIMTDIVVRAEGPAVIGSDRRAEITMVDGGSAANQAAWLAASGVPVALFARVGMADRDTIAARLGAVGIEPLIAGDRRSQSGRLITLVDPGGERSFFTDRGANLALSYTDLSPHWRTGTGLLVLSGYSFFVPGPRHCVVRMIAAAVERKLPVAVDAASAGFLAEWGGQAFIEWTHGCDMVVANADEAEVLTGTRDPHAQLAALNESYAVAVVKHGANGSFACLRGAAPVHEAAVKAEAVDSTGAGDAFLAGFIACWRTGGTVAACLSAGNKYGALAVGQVGGRPGPELDL